MGNVSSNCELKIKNLVVAGVPEAQNQALRGMYGVEPCCNNLQKVFKAVFAYSIIQRYNDTPSDFPTLRLINKKQAECICKWADRQTPDEVPTTQ